MIAKLVLLISARTCILVLDPFRMRFLFLGDIVGKPGYSAVVKYAKGLKI